MKKLEFKHEYLGEVFEIHGTYYPPCKGDRDKHGLQLEPDEEAFSEIRKVVYDGKILDTEEIASLLEVSEESVVEEFENAIMQRYHDIIEGIEEAKAISQYEDKKSTYL